jgi:hypothetical protein
MVRLRPSVIKEATRNLIAEGRTKVTFSEFVQFLQKESFLREILSEAQMYKMSADRLAYARNYDLVTLQQQELIKQMRQ